MSKIIFESLPRFDDPNELLKLPVGQSWLRDLAAQHEQTLASKDANLPGDAPNPSDIGLAEIEDADSGGGQVVEESPADGFDAFNFTLADTIAQLGGDVQAQTIAGIQSIASKLFPKLTAIFLADELAYHLPNLIPKQVPNVEIASSAGLSVRLQAALARSGALPPNCQFVNADEGEPEHSIRIVWPNGGYDFDFDALLTDCLAHLDTETQTPED
jgi:hypothetical protein